MQIDNVKKQAGDALSGAQKEAGKAVDSAKQTASDAAKNVDKAANDQAPAGETLTGESVFLYCFFHPPRVDLKAAVVQKR